MVMTNDTSAVYRHPLIDANMLRLRRRHIAMQPQHARITAITERQSGLSASFDISLFLNSLPNNLYNRLKRVIILCDIDRIERVIGEISKINPEAGKFLKTLANEYAYDEIAACFNEK